MTDQSYPTTPSSVSPADDQAPLLLRAEMPVSERLAYFDHAAVAPLTSSAASAIQSYAQAAASEGDLHWPTWSLAVERLRAVAAAFLGADQDELALIHNTTHGIGLVAEGFPWQAGDNVVVPENEFPSNLLPWAMLQRLGVELRRAEVNQSGTLDLREIGRLIDARTRIVSVSWVGFISGYRIDVGELADLVHKRGALLMLDAIQGLGAFKIDVRDTGVDFLVADGHKWMLGPEGAGLLYIRREHLQLLQPLGVGWNSLAGGSFDPKSVQGPGGLKPTAARFEGGSTNMPGMLALGQSLSLLNRLHGTDIDTSPIARRVVDNASLLAERLRQRGFQPHLPEPLAHRSGIVGITWPAISNRSSSPATKDSRGELPESLALAARKHCLAAGVVLSVRGGRLRASTHAYNNDHDIDRLVDALVHFRKTFAE